MNIDKLLKAAKKLANTAGRVTANIPAFDGAWALDAAIDKLRAEIIKTEREFKNDKQGIFKD